MHLIVGKLPWNNDIGFHGAWNPGRDNPRLTIYNNCVKPGLLVKLTPREDI
jgi:hypothetical protein